MQQLAIQDLARSGISERDALKAGLFDVADASAIDSSFRHAPALVIPYFDARGEIIYYAPDKPFCRVRYLDAPKSNAFTQKKRPKYGQPRNSGTRAYFAPILPWADILEDVGQPVMITEGEKKAVKGCSLGYPVIALGGVFNFTESYKLLPELAAAKWKGRTTYIVFDSDAVSNPNILAAEARLVDELTQRGAKCVIVRIPQEGDDKIGLDDFLARHGQKEFEALCQSAPALGALDVKCLALNKEVAWIEFEGKVYDLNTGLFIEKANFINGSVYSTLEHVTVGGAQRSAPKRISIAQTWLKHPHAQRYSEILFRPGEGVTVEGEGGRKALNMWRDWEPGDGSVEPFLGLDTFLFKRLPEPLRDLPLKLMAYKAQNPAEKVPLALVLIGKQGCGKTFWSEIIRDAFAPYGADVTPASLSGQFHNWLERSLVGVVHEAKPDDMERASEQLKALISDLRRPMNVKYRNVREVNSYTQYIITSNHPEVGAFAKDDRRMFVIDCPPRTDHGDAAQQAAFYDRVKAWREAGGPKALLGYLLRMDLKGWKPPATAPMTASKSMAHRESLTPIQELAERMEYADEHAVLQWLDSAWQWSLEAEQSGNPQTAARARIIKDNVPRFPIRPFYTPEELSMMFPVVVEQVLSVKYRRSTPAGEVSKQLRAAGVPYLENRDNPEGFRWHGLLRQYLVVTNFNDWREPLAQAEFERIMATAPTYAQVRKVRK